MNISLLTIFASGLHQHSDRKFRVKCFLANYTQMRDHLNKSKLIKKNCLKPDQHPPLGGNYLCDGD